MVVLKMLEGWGAPNMAEVLYPPFDNIKYLHTRQGCVNNASMCITLTDFQTSCIIVHTQAKYDSIRQILRKIVSLIVYYY